MTLASFFAPFCRSAFLASQSRPGKASFAAICPAPPADLDSALTADQLVEGLAVYRQVMRANRKALQKPSAVHLANAFVSAEFRSHMTAAAEAASQPASSRASEENENAATRQSIGRREFEMFLAAWREYVRLATDEQKPLQQGRSLRPSQRKMLSEEQRHKLEKLRDALRTSVSAG